MGHTCTDRMCVGVDVVWGELVLLDHVDRREEEGLTKFIEKQFHGKLEELAEYWVILMDKHKVRF